MDNEKWTLEQRAALHAQGRGFRLGLARQTPDEKAQQRARMSESLNAEQLDHLLHLWEALAIEVREISTQMQEVHKNLALNIGQLQNQQQHEDTDDHEGPLPAHGRV